MSLVINAIDAEAEEKALISPGYLGRYMSGMTLDKSLLRLAGDGQSGTHGVAGEAVAALVLRKAAVQAGGE